MSNDTPNPSNLVVKSDGTAVSTEVAIVGWPGLGDYTKKVSLTIELNQPNKATIELDLIGIEMGIVAPEHVNLDYDQLLALEMFCMAIRAAKYSEKKPTEDKAYNKFVVFRKDGGSLPGFKHEGCRYFVLDLDHDRLAVPALRAYAAEARLKGHPGLAVDLDQKAKELEQKIGGE